MAVSPLTAAPGLGEVFSRGETPDLGIIFEWQILLPILGLCLLAVLTVTIGLSLFASPDEADAIPAFARKYRMSCTTCHAPIPRLKEYGDEFAGNGFVQKGDPLLVVTPVDSLERRRIEPEGLE